MRVKRIAAALLAFAITVGIAGNAYAENTGQAMTAEIETAVSDKVQAEAEVSIPEPEQESESKIVRTELTEQNLPDVIDAETAIADGEEQSLSEVVLEKDDGTRALYLFSENVKYIDENGDVADKSNNAVRKGRAFVNEGNDVEIILPATLTAGIAVHSDELNITMKPLTDSIGRSLSTAVQTEEDTVLYSDVFDSSTDIEYTYTYSGVKENIILESYNGKNSFDYEVTTGGLTLYEDKGTLLLADENGEVKATLGEVIVFSADNKNNTFGKYTIKELEKNSRYKVTVSVDREYLTDPKTKYPVKIDPNLNTIDYNIVVHDMQVFKGKDGKGTSETSAGYSGVSRVGWTDWGACRTLIKLNNFSFATYKISNSWQIESAYIELRDLMCQGGSGVPISCGQFNGNFWTEKDTRTWNGLEAENSSLSSPVSVTYGNGNSKRNLSDKDQWYNWNITGIVKKWAIDSSLKEKGLQLRTYTTFFEDSSVYAEYMKTFSSMQGNANYKPYIKINYIHKGALLYGIECEGYDCSNPLINTQSILSKYSYNTTIRRMASVKATDVVKKLEGDKSNNIFFFFSDGGYKNNMSTMVTYTTDELTPNSFKNVKDLSHVKVALLVGCNTTKADNNIPAKMVNLGTKYSVGFDTYIYADEAENFIIDFFDYYANKGYTAHNATDTAAKKMSLTDLSSYKVGKNVLYSEYGNTNQKFIN